MSILIIRKKILYFLLILIILFTALFYYYQVKPTSTNSKMEFKVIIDPGHGGIDTGTHYHNQLFEKDINLKTAFLLKEKLKKVNIIPILTRSDDKLYNRSRSDDIKHRPELANKHKADLFISLHVNSFSSPQPSGGHIFYKINSYNSKILAEKLFEEINNLQASNQKEVAPGNYYVLNNCNCPAVLFEMGFISNPDDRKKLTDEYHLEKLAEAIRDGVVEYLKYQINSKNSDIITNKKIKSPGKEDYSGSIKVNNQSYPLLYYFAIKNNKLVLVSRDFIYPTGFYLNQNLKNMSLSEFIIKHSIDQLKNPPPELYSILPEGTEIKYFKLNNGTLAINFNDNIIKNFQGGALQEQLLLAALNSTFLSIPEVNNIKLLVNAKPLTTIGGHIYLTP